MSAIRVNRRLVIPDDEIQLRFTTSGGPGGQHANRSSTRVELIWNVRESNALGPRQRDRILGKLRNRIDGNGNLRVASDRHRSQLRNRIEVQERLASLVEDALRVERTRVGTAPTRSSKEKRLRSKKLRSQTKRMRGRVDLD